MTNDIIGCSNNDSMMFCKQCDRHNTPECKEFMDKYNLTGFKSMED